MTAKKFSTKNCNFLILLMLKFFLKIIIPCAGVACILDYGVPFKSFENIILLIYMVGFYYFFIVFRMEIVFISHSVCKICH